jgi:ribosomal protein L32
MFGDILKIVGLSLLGLILVSLTIALLINWYLRKREKRRDEKQAEIDKTTVFCPKCGHSNYRARVTTGDLRCNHCGHIWKPEDYGQYRY